jgi:hypothetical protein
MHCRYIEVCIRVRILGGYMKYFVLLSIVFVMGCSKKADLNPVAFQKMPVIERSAFFNTLSKSQKIELFARYARGNQFLSPPNDYIQFRADGMLVHVDSIGGGKCYGVIGQWKYDNGTVTLEAVNDNEGMSNILGAEVFSINSVSAELLNTNPPSLSYDLEPGKIILISE